MEVLLRNEENEPIYPKTRAGLVTRPGGGDVEAALKALEGGRGLRPLFEAAGAKYNKSTGFYELNGLTDISEAEMVEIYVQTGTFGCGDNYSGVAARTNIRTNFLIPNIEYVTWYGNLKNLQGAFRDCKRLEVCKLAKDDNTYIKVSDIATIFESSTALRRVIGIIDVAESNKNIAFVNTASLEGIKIKNLNGNLSISKSPMINLESLSYIVGNNINDSPITVTVHPDVLAKLQDAEGHPEWHAVNTAAQEKQISFATVD